MALLPAGGRVRPILPWSSRLARIPSSQNNFPLNEKMES